MMNDIPIRGGRHEKIPPHSQPESWLLLAAFAMTGVVPLPAVDTTDTKFLTKPAVSAERVAFVYADDLWTADLEGRNVRRLTSGVGTETNPSFSPDGRLVAFSGQYDGNMDVYVVPAGGGVPKRLTWHPAADIVLGFTPTASRSCSPRAGSPATAPIPSFSPCPSPAAKPGC